MFDFGGMSTALAALQTQFEQINERLTIVARLTVYRDCPYSQHDLAALHHLFCGICGSPANWHRGRSESKDG